MTTDPKWICCQLSAREHYAFPRALYGAGRLQTLIVDAWVNPNRFIKKIPGLPARRLSERYHSDLSKVEIIDFTFSLLVHTIGWRSRQLYGWNLFIARNKWFQKRAAKSIVQLRKKTSGNVVFAHSYAAREIFRRAKSFGWTAVLGQIDPGEEHFRIVERAYGELVGYGPPPTRPPEEYFAGWREECHLADWIVVNSEWSAEALSKVGIPSAKIRIIPLTYEPLAGLTAHFQRTYPTEFSNTRPLRALFVGHGTVAKGLPALLDSLKILEKLPIELWVAGLENPIVPAAFRSHPSIRWFGSVSRNEIMDLYRQADVLVFPSLSDGFGMVQVEAQGWSLPIIASRNCGRVVVDRVTGIILPEVSARVLATELHGLLLQPSLLDQYCKHLRCSNDSRLPKLADQLLEMVAAPTAQ